MATAGTLKGVLTLDQAQYVAGLKDASELTKKFGDEHKKQGGLLGMFQEHLHKSSGVLKSFAAISGQSAGSVMHLAHAFTAIGGPAGIALGAMLLVKEMFAAQEEAAKKTLDSNIEYVESLKHMREEMEKFEQVRAQKEIDELSKSIAKLRNEMLEVQEGGLFRELWTGELKTDKLDELNSRLETFKKLSAQLRQEKGPQEEHRAEFRNMKEVEFRIKMNEDPNHKLHSMHQMFNLLTAKAREFNAEMNEATKGSDEQQGFRDKYHATLLEMKQITDEIKKQGREITNSVNPMAKFKEEVADLDELLKAGAIDQSTYDKKVLEDRKKMFQEQSSLSGAGGAPHLASAVNMSNLAVEKLKHSSNGPAQQHLAVARDMLAAQKQTNILLQNKTLSTPMAV